MPAPATPVAQSIRVRPAAGPAHRAVLQLGDARFPAAIGRTGITRAKREGDGATPAATLRPLQLLYRQDRLKRPWTFLPLRPIRPDDGWCDDPGHRDYNRAVRLPHPARHEELWRDDRLYDLVVVLNWNTVPRRRGTGSAIFLHIAAPGLAPTAGCIAVTPPVMRRLLAAMDQTTRIIVG